MSQQANQCPNCKNPMVFNETKQTYSCAGCKVETKLFTENVQVEEKLDTK